MARNTPILINPLPAIVEYLGREYPFYFTSLEEAAEKLTDLDLICRAHKYLAVHPAKEKLTGTFFLKSMAESPIYRALPAGPAAEARRDADRTARSNAGPLRQELLREEGRSRISCAAFTVATAAVGFTHWRT